MNRLPLSLQRLLLRVGDRVIRLASFVVKLRTRGVKCVISRGQDVMLVRHTYGNRRRWELPGGRVRRGEDPLQAARREVREEIGVEISEWAPLGNYVEPIHRRRDTLYSFRARVDDLELHIDPVEIAEARWFGRDHLPANTRSHVRRIIALADRS
jgi:8-oxo-dGTP pyrophosphatase MutT (NUDIX family)